MDITPKQVIASESIVVKDVNMEIDRQIVQGQPVPPDLVEAYNAATGRSSSTSAPESKDDPETKDALLALKRDELDERATALGVEDVEKLGTKADVVDAILAASK